MRSLTEAGQTKPNKGSTDPVDVINQVFALLQANYHNQYYKAFPTTETENITKKLWLQSLQDIPARALLSAAEKLVKTQEYLPTLAQMLRLARAAAGDALPDVHSAFLEACRAASPKSAQPWSHPIVYHAGQRTGWHLLGSQPERLTYPLYRKQFELLEQELLAGKVLALPQAEAATSAADPSPVDVDEGRARLAALRANLKL